MNYKANKGFTLVELLAIISVLAIIALTTYPVVSYVIKKGRNRSYETQVKLIENAATSYVTEDPNGKYENLDSIAIPLSELQRLKVVKKTTIVNPKTEKPMNGCVKITKDSYGQYKAKYQDNAC